jgi:hypothetical protein
MPLILFYFAIDCRQDAKPDLKSQKLSKSSSKSSNKSEEKKMSSYEVLRQERMKKNSQVLKDLVSPSLCRLAVVLQRCRSAAWGF